MHWTWPAASCAAGGDRDVVSAARGIARLVRPAAASGLRSTQPCASSRLVGLGVIVR